MSGVDSYFVPAMDGIRLAEQADALQRAEGTPHKFAEPVAISITPETHGTWESLSNGDRLWRLRIHAPGATDLNLGFTRYQLPPGATLHVIAEGRDYWEGPYTYEDNADHGQLWLPVTPGDRAVIELYVPRDVKFEPELTLAQIGYGFRDWFHLEGPLRQGACNNDVICPEGDPWRDDIASAAVYQRNGSWTCSGQMMNNTAADFTPYFLTANHCGVTSSSAPTMVVYWNFESPVCGMLSGGSLADNQTGAIWRASYSASDFTIVQLEENPVPEWQVYFAGWDRSGIAPASDVGIHHPNCDEKAISFDYNPAIVTSYLGNTSPGDGTHWKIISWDDGVTEPGSSGSGIWNENHQLVGQLHGGYSSCSLPNDPDWYGRVSVSWSGGGTSSSRLRDWLDPSNTGAMTFDGAYAAPPAPVIRFTSFDGIDGCLSGGPGDGNAVWEPGEQVQIPVVLSAAYGSFTGVTGTLSSSSAGVTVLDGAASWPDIPIGGTATSEAPHFMVAIEPWVLCGAVLDFELTVTAAEGGPWSFAFSHDVGQALVPAGLPASIPDNNPAGVTSTLTVAQSVSLTDVNVRVQIDHTWVGDLMVRLQSPAGTTVTLLDRPGVPASTYGCSNDDMDVTFDSASSYNLESHCAGTTPWYSGVAAPTQTLNVLNGQGSFGEWKLIVSDHAGSDTGALLGWELLTTPEVTGVCEECTGPVLVQLSGLTATAAEREVVVEWQTALEVDHAGFHVYRADASNGAYARLTVSGPIEAAGSPYRWIDRDVRGDHTYWYQIGAVDTQDREELFGPVAVTTPHWLMLRTALYPPRPNPLLDQTEFRFVTESEGPVALAIYDVSGRVVHELTRGVLPAGEHKLRWGGRDAAGNRVPAGVYFSCLTTGNGTRTQKLTVLGTR